MSLRPRIGARAVALVATLVVLIAASVVMDRLGAPPGLVRTVVILFSVVSIGTAGALTRTVRGSTYFSAGQRLGSLRATSATLLTGLGLLFALAPGDQTMLAGLALGMIGHAAFLAAPLQRSGVSSLGALALARYRSRTLSFTAGTVIFVIAGLLAHIVAGAAVDFLKPATGLGEPLLRMSIALLALLAVLPGGYASLAAAGVIVVLLGLAGTALSLASLAALRGEALASASQLVLRDAMGLAMTPQIAGTACTFAGLLAILSVAPTCRKQGIARQSGAAAVLLLLAMSFAAAVIGVVAAASVAGGDRADSLAISTALGTPSPFIVLFAMMPGLTLTGLLAALARVAATGLVQDAFGALSRNHGAVSGRLALHRIVTIVLVLSAIRGLPAPIAPSWLEALQIAAATLPLALIGPALLRRADWRSAAVSLGTGLVLAGVAGTAAVPLALLQITAIFVGVSALGLAVFRSADPEDRRAADVMTGRSPGPLSQARDA